MSLDFETIAHIVFFVLAFGAMYVSFLRDSL
jgi:hypothetical protein